MPPRVNNKILLVSLVAILGYLTLTKSGRGVANKIGARIMLISNRGIDFITKEEGFSPVPYADAGGFSIGYGHFILPGEKFTRVTEPQARALLTADVMKANDAVARYVKVPLTQNQHDALVSLIYNIGVGNFSGSTLLRKLNARDYVGAAGQFDVWNKYRPTKNSLPQIHPVLVTRRAGERRVFES